MKRLLLPITLSLCFSLSTPAWAIYKCESNGAVIYSDTPCQGKSVNLTDQLNHSVSPEETAQARQRTLQEKKEAARLEKIRHKQEALEEKENRQATRAASKHRKTCAKLAQHVKWSEEDARHAAGRSFEKARRKARRAAEKYALEC